MYRASSQRAGWTRQTKWFSIQKEVSQRCILIRGLFHLYSKCIIRTTQLEDNEANCRIVEQTKPVLRTYHSTTEKEGRWLNWHIGSKTLSERASKIEPKENQCNEHWGTALCRQWRNQHSYKLWGCILVDGYAKDEIKRVRLGKAAMANLTKIMSLRFRPTLNLR
jgi:hypothetical protein